MPLFGENSITHFTMIPVDAWKRTQDLAAIGLLGYFCDRLNHNSKQFCWPSLATVEKDLNTTRKTILKKIKVLEDCGLLIIQRGNRNTSSKYSPQFKDRGSVIIPLGGVKKGSEVVENLHLKDSKEGKPLNNNQLSSGLSQNCSIPSTLKEECGPDQIDLIGGLVKFGNICSEAKHTIKSPVKQPKFSQHEIDMASQDRVIPTTGNNITTPELQEQSFKDNFWNLYSKKGKTDRKACLAKYKRLSKHDRAAIKIHVPKYLVELRSTGTTDQYLKAPKTYLNSEVWKEDEEPEVSQIDQKAKNMNPRDTISIQSWINNQNLPKETKSKFWSWFRENTWVKNVNLFHELERFKGKK